jgi:hypothetical protein
MKRPATGPTSHWVKSSDHTTDSAPDAHAMERTLEDTTCMESWWISQSKAILTCGWLSLRDGQVVSVCCWLVLASICFYRLFPRETHRTRTSSSLTVWRAAGWWTTLAQSDRPYSHQRRERCVHGRLRPTLACALRLVIILSSQTINQCVSVHLQLNVQRVFQQAKRICRYTCSHSSIRTHTTHRRFFQHAFFKFSFLVRYCRTVRFMFLAQRYFYIL